MTRRPTPSICGWDNGWYAVPHEVTWQDIDAMGHVNNAVYFAYFEWARTKYWIELSGTSEIDPRSIGFIVAHADCDFQRELRLLDVIHIRVRIDEMRTSSLDFVYEIVNAGNGEIAATGKVVVVLYSWEDRTKMPISDSFRTRVREFQSRA